MYWSTDKITLYLLNAAKSQPTIFHAVEDFINLKLTHIWSASFQPAVKLTGVSLIVHVFP